MALSTPSWWSATRAASHGPRPGATGGRNGDVLSTLYWKENSLTCPNIFGFVSASPLREDMEAYGSRGDPKVNPEFHFSFSCCVSRSACGNLAGNS